MGESENRFVVSDHMDSSLPKKRKVRKRIFSYINRAPNIYCVCSTGDLKNMAGSLFFIIKELLVCNIELKQCLQSSNDDEAICFFLMEFQQVGGNTWGAETFLSSLLRAIRSKSNITGKLLARYSFCESFPKKTLESRM